MAWTNRRCAALAITGALLGCSVPPDDPGPGTDAGPPPAVDPVFLAGPSLEDAVGDAVTVTFETDLAVTGSVQWLAARRNGSSAVDVPATRHAVRLTGLVPGRTLEVAVAVRTEAGGRATAAVRGRTGLWDLGVRRVLFDAAHGQQAGNADWVIDDSGRHPVPANPARESDWNGAYSAFAFDLHAAGRYAVEVLPAGARFELGGGGAQDLEGYDVVVLPEPNTRLTAAERAALADFVRAGGGLLAIGNHGGADRDNDGWDAVAVLNELFAGGAFGVRLSGDRRDGPARGESDHPLSDGPFGPALTLGGFDGSTLRLDVVENPEVALVAKLRTGEAYVASLTLGAGRAVVHGDSAAADDGTDSGGNANIFDAWSEQDNAPFFLNAVAWLGGEY